MRTYLILKEKAEKFNQDSEIQALLAEITASDPSLDYLSSGYSKEAADKLRSTEFDRSALGARNLPYEHLDQLTVELLLGVR
jgi:xylose isomerase